MVFRVPWFSGAGSRHHRPPHGSLGALAESDSQGTGAAPRRGPRRGALRGSLGDATRLRLAAAGNPSKIRRRQVFFWGFFKDFLGDFLFFFGFWKMARSMFFFGF